MIHIERARMDENGDPVEPRDGWLVAAAAMTTQAVIDGPKHLVTDLYRDNRVKAALEMLFDDKCAYCETPGIAGFPWDVEHFRPKGRVAEDQNHPGYYWLAYEWTNLYLSCVYCNQRRQDKPRWNDPATNAAAGKVDQFPIDPPQSRAMQPGQDVTTEGRPLLDPCSDQPEDHLSFTPKGSAIARNGSARAKESIRVFALNRKRLRDARVLQIRLVAGIIEENVRLGNDRLISTQATLVVFSKAKHPYAGVVRAMHRDPAAFGL